MAHLDALTIVAKPDWQPKTVVEQRRLKLITKLQEQLRMVEAELGGKRYQRLKWTTDVDEDGQPVRVQMPTRLKAWWLKDAAGVILFSLRYGAKPIALNKDGKSAVEVGKLERLPEVITILIKAVQDGELDAQLSAISADRPLLPSKAAKPASKR